jgi:hypothetical protein
MSGFTDNACAAVMAGFRGRPSAPERDVVAALAAGCGVAPRLLRDAGVSADALSASTTVVQLQALVREAVEESRQQGVAYIGTDHILLAIARNPDSALAMSGASADRLQVIQSVVEAEWRRAHPP